MSWLELNLNCCSCCSGRLTLVVAVTSVHAYSFSDALRPPVYCLFLFLVTPYLFWATYGMDPSFFQPLNAWWCFQLQVEVCVTFLLPPCIKGLKEYLLIYSIFKPVKILNYCFFIVICRTVCKFTDFIQFSYKTFAIFSLPNFYSTALVALTCSGYHYVAETPSEFSNFSLKGCVWIFPIKKEWLVKLGALF